MLNSAAVPAKLFSRTLAHNSDGGFFNVTIRTDGHRRVLLRFKLLFPFSTINPFVTRFGLRFTFYGAASFDLEIRRLGDVGHGATSNCVTNFNSIFAK